MEESNGRTLSADRLVKVYNRRRVVDEVTLTVDQGEIVGLLGPNGAGKTTTFYMMVGLIRPKSGSILLEGKNVTSLPMYRRARLGVGYLAQDASVFRKLTVEQNLLAILETFMRSSSTRQMKCDELLKDLNLSHLRKQKAFTLSGGERRRVEIARALVTEPDFILLDEPFTGVDPIAVEEIQEILGTLKEKGLGVLITDHNVRETLHITDRAYIMNEGKILVSGDAKSLVDDPIARKVYLGQRFTLN
ncbi:LPS export ABC transporter ATP-binding protein [Candidatus Zixiibacteriota bacterium]